MAIVRQFGADGATYDTNDYPYVLMRRALTPFEAKNIPLARFSTLEKAHQGRLMHQLNNPNDMLLLWNERTDTFLAWRKKELILLQKYKDNPSKYFDKFMKRSR